jgi:hypothetical protein
VSFNYSFEDVDIHEGHGGSGTATSFAAAMNMPPPLVSQRTGTVLLTPRLQAGALVTWSSNNEAVWADHGSFSPALEQPTPLDSSIQGVAVLGARIRYTPKREAANGSGTSLVERGSLSVSADQRDLVEHAYDLDIDGAYVLPLISGWIRFTATWPIGWHQAGDGYWVEITWTDVFDGIADTVKFRGIIDRKDTSVPGVDAWYTGTGTASGARFGWARCNPSVDLVPAGSGPAEFQAGIETTSIGREVVIAAWPALGHALQGTFAGPFRLPADGGAAEQPVTALASGDVCSRGLAWKITAKAFGNP